MARPVQALVFDLSEVCLSGLKGTHERIGARLGLPVGEDVLLGERASELFRGRISEDDYWAGLVEDHGWSVSVADLKRMVRENFERVEGTDEILRELRAAGYAMALLSVHAREWVEHCTSAFRHDELFDVELYSFQNGLLKPDVAAYEAALAALGVPAERTVFVDDALPNVLAARSVGMRAIHFTSAAQLREELVAWGVLATSPGAAATAGAG